MKKLVFTRLAFKLSFIITMVLVLLLILQTVITTQKLKRDLIETLAQNSYSLSEVIKSSTRYSMLQNSKRDVNQILKDIGNSSRITSLKIYDKQGVVVFANDIAKIHQQADKNSKICSPCHLNQIPVAKLSIKEKMQIEDLAGTKEMVIINPIENHPDCTNVGCHENTEKKAVLGILEMKISLSNIDEILDKNVSTVATYSIIGTVILVILVAGLITIMVNKPLQSISKGIKEISAGNLRYRLRIRSKNELGDVARQMNEMSAKLDTAYEEIKDWNAKLNLRVEEKSNELKALYDQIIQIEKLASLGKLSATVAHELNNPLAGILNYSKLIAKKLVKIQKEEEYKNILEFLKLISDESERCGRIVKDLLLFSHKGNTEFQVENLVATIEKTILLINHHLGIHQIKLIKEFQALDVLVTCNASKIQQALMSILINAIESMPNGGDLKLQLTFDKEMVYLRISDMGIGIAAVDLPNIFEPFYTTKDAIKGTGLGLSVAYGIVTSHDGNIEVESTSPAGTTFLISLPQKR